MPSWSSKDIIDKILRAGFVEQKGRGKGSHRYFTHPKTGQHITVPGNRESLAPGTLRQIWRQANLPWPPD